MVRRLFILLTMLPLGILVFGQTSGYLIKEKIPYYDEAVCKQDAYIAERCVLDIYYPAQSKNFATIIWFHGGGLSGGDKHIPQELKEKGFCVVAVNYRLYPKVKCPKYIEDAAAAVAWVFSNIKEYGGNPRMIFVSGHSAGAYLTLMIGLDKQWLKPYQIDPDSIAALFPLSGHTITHYSIRQERGISDTQAVVDEFAPLFHVRASTPPMILMTGDRELEMLGRYEENAYLMRMMKLSGHTRTVLHEFDGYGHSMTEPAFPLVVKYINKRIAEINARSDIPAIPAVSQTRIIAHRGFWDSEGSAQNSVSALKNAQKERFYGSECDVHATLDGVVVLNHDDEINGLIINESTFAQLQKVRLKNGERIPTLENYLKQIAKSPDTKLIIELKPKKDKNQEDKIVALVLRLVEKLKMEKQIEYISFSRYICRELKRKSPRSIVSFLSGLPSEALPPQTLVAEGFNGLDYSFGVIEAFPHWIKEAKELGLTTNVWTVNDEKTMKQMLELKIDFITTDKPLELRNIILRIDI